MDLFEQQHFEFRDGELNWACQCPKCGKKFEQRSKLMLHITTKHTSIRSSNGKLYQCDRCRVKFLHKQSLQKHVTTHHTNGHRSIERFLFMCRECDQMFDCEYNLWCHMMLHALEKPIAQGNNIYQCGKCWVSFFNRHEWKEHARSHQETNRKLFTCDLCFQKFDRKELILHRLDKHQDVQMIISKKEDATEKLEKPYKCKECNSRFSHSNYLEWHMNLHPKRSVISIERIFDMLKCGLKFDLMAQRKFHWKSSREHILRSQSEPYTMDLSVVESLSGRLYKLKQNVGSAFSNLLPKPNEKQIFGIDNIIRNSSFNWYV
ncbi:hypothetical protein RDWZM_005010 [Blomia tropicalis]|uniref:C2H2-type domain-containing protein n=1 Tax=Blomia tropicalis TaxID=40697 RepID=A0A9Q0M380_BLOTA|nr:hypothetical protein RDWZM_005010 [Blomia tropicalis]